MLRQLQSDVHDHEEAELRILEGGRPLGADRVLRSATTVRPELARPVANDSDAPSDLRVARAVPAPLAAAGGGCGGGSQAGGGEGGGPGPMRARKTKRMDRRLLSG